MKACYFGTYEKAYPRNRVVVQGLKKKGVNVVECHYPLWERIEHKARLSIFSKIGLVLRMPLAYLKLASCLRKSSKDSDCIIVGYIGQIDMLVARLFARNKKIILNPMISLYDTMVNDRKTVRNPLMKWLLHWLDSKACRLADLVVLDTEEHADYFRKEFGLKNVSVLPVGADIMFVPGKHGRKNLDKEVIKVLFYGKYTPLHGTRTVIEAAKILEKDKDIYFEIIGTGQTYEEDMQFARKIKLGNVKFTRWVPYNKLPDRIAEADICLGGHFGTGKKALRVVPNKVFQIMAMGKPVVVNDSNTMKKAGFKDKENCVFARPGHAGSIAKAIMMLKNNASLREKTGKNARKLYVERYSPEKIGESLIKKIDGIKK